MTSSLSIEEIWRRYDATEQRLTSQVSHRMLELARIRAGMHVLDLATGRGEPAILAAQHVGPTGRVVGVDLSKSMLDMTRQRADESGLANLELIVDDAQSMATVPELNFDAVFSRWGLMYMSDPVKALTAAGRLCKSTARLVAAFWAEPERVDYVNVPSKQLERYMSLPPVINDQPGTFRYADPAMVARDFALAGWQVEAVEEMYVSVMEARTGNELVQWCECFGMNRLMQGLPEATRAAWRSDMEAEFDRLVDTHGVVRLGGVTRLVVAQRIFSVK